MSLPSDLALTDNDIEQLKKLENTQRTVDALEELATTVAALPDFEYIVKMYTYYVEMGVFRILFTPPTSTELENLREALLKVLNNRAETPYELYLSKLLYIAQIYSDHLREALYWVATLVKDLRTRIYLLTSPDVVTCVMSLDTPMKACGPDRAKMLNCNFVLVENSVYYPGISTVANYVLFETVTRPILSQTPTLKELAKHQASKIMPEITKGRTPLNLFDTLSRRLDETWLRIYLPTARIYADIFDMPPLSPYTLLGIAVSATVDIETLRELGIDPVKDALTGRPVYELETYTEHRIGLVTVVRTIHILTFLINYSRNPYDLPKW